MRVLLNNWAYFLWSIICFFITASLIGNYYITGIIYLVSILFMFTQVSEDLFRLAYGLKMVNDNYYYEKIAPVFAEVYIKAMRDGLRKKKKINQKILFYMENSMKLNACAIGRTVIGVTKGSVDMMTPDELKGLFAHELGHIISGTTKVALFCLTCNFYFSILYWLCMFIMTIINGIMHLSLKGSTDRSGKRIDKPELIIIRIPFTIIRWVLSLIPGIFNLFIMANSRNNEYIADSYAVSLGYGTHLASALKKLSRLETGESKGVFAHFKDSHPYTLERIARIETNMNESNSNFELLKL